MERRTFLKGIVGAGVLGAGTTGAYASLVERHAVQVRPVPLVLGLGSRLRIAALGDLHLDPLYELDYLRDVMALAAAQTPDAVCFTGDFVSHVTHRFEEFTALLGILRPPLGIYAALGNHDHWSGRREITRLLEAAGVEVLRNRSLPLPRHPGWRIGGVDSYWAGKPDLAQTLGPGRDRFLLLVHEPDPFALIEDPRVRLQISGHTHGGQVRAPFIGALRLPSWGLRYDAGLFERDGRFLYVNRGIGTVGPPVRFNCPPEITLLELS